MHGTRWWKWWIYYSLISLFFFFQAEDGIRDYWRDWSSDVCSSDLICESRHGETGRRSNRCGNHTRSGHFQKVRIQTDRRREVRRSISEMLIHNSGSRRCRSDDHRFIDEEYTLGRKESHLFMKHFLFPR